MSRTPCTACPSMRAARPCACCSRRSPHVTRTAAVSSPDFAAGADGMSTATAAGFYGKLPCKGDFLQRRVPQEFVDAWDPWLQECLHVSRRSFEERWLDLYLTGPVWRFALSEGVCGSGAYVGAVFPSLDRVGRHFPLTIVAQIAVEDCPLEIACDEQSWFERVEEVGL